MNREEIIKLAREAEFHVTGERVQSPVICGMIRASWIVK